MVIHLHGEIRVATRVAGHDTLIDGLAIDEQLESRARLTLGSHLVVFPRLEVYVAYPGLDMTRLWFHSDKAAVHEVLHVSDAVHG